jgi:hypothetical protein
MTRDDLIAMFLKEVNQGPVNPALVALFDKTKAQQRAALKAFVAAHKAERKAEVDGWDARAAEHKKQAQDALTEVTTIEASL